MFAAIVTRETCFVCARARVLVRLCMSNRSCCNDHLCACSIGVGDAAIDQCQGIHASRYITILNQTSNGCIVQTILKGVHSK